MVTWPAVTTTEVLHGVSMHRDGDMVPSASHLPDVLPSARLNERGKPVPPLRDQLRKIPNARNALAVVSTLAQSFGLVIAEAMACGRTLVTTGLGGAREIVSDGVDALVVPPGDHRALASAIYRLAIDTDLRDRLGSHARASAMVRFNTERLAPSLIALYEQATSARDHHGADASTRSSRSRAQSSAEPQAPSSVLFPSDR